MFLSAFDLHHSHDPLRRLQGGSQYLIVLFFRIYPFRPRFDVVSMGLVLLDINPADIALPSLLGVDLKLLLIIECPKIQERLGDIAAQHALIDSTFLLHSSALNNFVGTVRVRSVFYSRSPYFRCSTPQLTCFTASRGLNRQSIPFLTSPRSSTEVSYSLLSCASLRSSRPQ